MNEIQTVYRLLKTSQNGVPLFKIGVCKDGSFTFDWFDGFFCGNPEIDKRMKDMRVNHTLEYVEEFRKNRRNPHSSYCFLPYKASNPEYEEAFISLYAVLDYYTNGYGSAIGIFVRQAFPDLKRFRPLIEYLGEGEPWIPNPDYAERLRFLSMGCVY